LKVPTQVANKDFAARQNANAEKNDVTAAGLAL
jgi:hypothetical protein